MPTNKCNNPKGVWEEGDIAYLRPSDEYTAEETAELIRAPTGHRHGHIPARATGHPVIILSRTAPTSSHVLVSTVSAYGSGDLASGRYVAPWNNPRQHRYKPDSFRSFEGCELYRGRGPASRPALRLRKGSQFPKPETSWVNVQNAYVVPVSVLGIFTKARKGRSVVLLQMEQESLSEFRDDMARRCPSWDHLQRMLRSREREVVVTVPHGQPSLGSAMAKLSVRASERESSAKAITCDRRAPAVTVAPAAPAPVSARPQGRGKVPAIATKSWAAIAAH
ncbi:hypothetical protein QBC44DRAFT_238411 [Cladorrhinum sp. PSN332]|nr:hypothetical protein QBC44DRAFT_238411 [Cladorrhinum sp. PSN332]